jgi:hypothetical protein
MKHISQALSELGLDQNWFNELKSEVESDKTFSENGLLTTTREDVEDEFGQLDVRLEKNDDNDESFVDMDAVSSTMANVFNQKQK